MTALNISSDFVGGNIVIGEVNNNTITLFNDLRGTSFDWFYWAFSIEGAQGKSIKFKFNQQTRIGPWGPAISYDLINWHWLGKKDLDEAFTYSFRDNENKVYFAHSMLYHPNRFFYFAKQKGMVIKTLCKSEKGRDVPFITFGNGSKNIILTARHHACESSGSYVLEGVLDIIKDYHDLCIYCIPFVDYDGVIDGDQGKNRSPHDHNRDYDITHEPIYCTTSKIREYSIHNDIYAAFDFHSPLHTEENLFIVHKSINDDKTIAFSKLLENNITEKSMKYKRENDYPANTGWNKDNTPNIGSFILATNPNALTFSFETSYFGSKENIFEMEKAIEFGRCFGRSLIEYIENSER